MKLLIPLAALAALCNTVTAKDILSVVVQVEKGNTLDDLYCPDHKEDVNTLEQYLFNRIVEGVEDYAKESGEMDPDVSIKGADMTVTKVGDGHRVLFSAAETEATRGLSWRWRSRSYGSGSARFSGDGDGDRRALESGEEQASRGLWSWWGFRSNGARFSGDADGDRRALESGEEQASRGLWSWWGFRSNGARFSGDADGDRRALESGEEQASRGLWSWWGFRSNGARFSGDADGDRRLVQTFEKQVSKFMTEAVQKECRGTDLTIDIFIDD